MDVLKEKESLIENLIWLDRKNTFKMGKKQFTNIKRCGIEATSKRGLHRIKCGSRWCPECYKDYLSKKYEQENKLLEMLDKEYVFIRLKLETILLEENFCKEAKQFQYCNKKLFQLEDIEKFTKYYAKETFIDYLKDSGTFVMINDYIIATKKEYLKDTNFLRKYYWISCWNKSNKRVLPITINVAYYKLSKNKPFFRVDKFSDFHSKISSMPKDTFKEFYNFYLRHQRFTHSVKNIND